jgi:hypothetical protein
MGFGPLHQIIPGFTNFHELPPVSLSFSTSFITSSLNLFSGCPLVLIPKVFLSVVFLSVIISSSQLRCLYHFILGGKLTLTSIHTHTHTLALSYSFCKKKYESSFHVCWQNTNKPASCSAVGSRSGQQHVLWVLADVHWQFHTNSSVGIATRLQL